MGKKNWIEFDNQEEKSEEKAKVESFNKISSSAPKPQIKVTVFPFLPFFCFEIFIFDLLLTVSTLAVSSDCFS